MRKHAACETRRETRQQGPENPISSSLSPAPILECQQKLNKCLRSHAISTGDKTQCNSQHGAQRGSAASVNYLSTTATWEVTVSWAAPRHRGGGQYLGARFPAAQLPESSPAASGDSCCSTSVWPPTLLAEGRISGCSTSTHACAWEAKHYTGAARRPHLCRYGALATSMFGAPAPSQANPLAGPVRRGL